MIIFHNNNTSKILRSGASLAEKYLMFLMGIISPWYEGHILMLVFYLTDPVTVGLIVIATQFVWFLNLKNQLLQPFYKKVLSASARL